MKKLTLKDLLKQLDLKKEQVLVLDALIEYLRLFLPEEQLHQVGSKKAEVTLDDCVVPKVGEEALEAVLSSIVEMAKQTTKEITSLEEGDINGSVKSGKKGKA